MNILNKATAKKDNNLPLKVMQFGGGNFLRAFVDWMIEVLNEKTDFNGGIVIVKPTERGDYHELKEQDGYFNVILDGIKDGELIAEKTLVSSVKKTLNVYTEWDAYLALAKSDSLRFVVSNTTEAGIKFNEKDQFEGPTPKEFPAKLTIWLHRRFTHFNGDTSKGCILLPCELIENNGDVLKETILQYAEHWQLEKEFSVWIESSNYFCSTLVDRIVSGYPSDRSDSIQKELGYKDQLLVAGEYYHSWVIQGPEIVQKELPFAQTGLNVAFVKDLAPYREMKVRILNGAHTSMVPVAYLYGIRLVKEAMADTVISQYITSLLMHETVKTLDFPDAVKNKFVQDVLDRFRNPLLKHQLISIALNSTSKFVARLLPTLKDYHHLNNELPKRIVFAFAAMIRFYKGEFAEEKIELKDDQSVLDFFKNAWTQFDNQQLSLQDMVKLVLTNKSIWGEDLNSISGLNDLVVRYLSDIESKGIEVTLSNIN